MAQEVKDTLHMSVRLADLESLVYLNMIKICSRLSSILSKLFRLVEILNSVILSIYFALPSDVQLTLLPWLLLELVLLTYWSKVVLYVFYYLQYFRFTIQLLKERGAWF